MKNAIISDTKTISPPHQLYLPHKFSIFQVLN